MLGTFHISSIAAWIIAPVGPGAAVLAAGIVLAILAAGCIKHKRTKLWT